MWYSVIMKPKEIIGAGIFILFFVAGTIIAREFSGDIVKYLDFGIVGMAVYVLVGIVATVIAPISTVSLIPIAVVLWGPFVVAVLSIVAWTIGSGIAFVIARRFGKPLIARFVDLRTIEKYEHAVGGTYVFWDIVFLRMVVPVDILSYAIGLFTSVKMGRYLAATIIGIMPFAFILSFATEATLGFQIMIAFLVLTMVYLGYRRVRSAKT